MSTPENKFSRCERLRRSVLAGIAVILMGASLVITGNTSAHNIDVKKARQLAREYARQVRDESGGKYLHYSTRCGAMFPNHNHYARCTIEYQNAKDKAAGVYTCKETIELFMRPNGSPGRRGPDIYDIFGRHTSFKCGSRKLNETFMG